MLTAIKRLKLLWILCPLELFFLFGVFCIFRQTDEDLQKRGVGKFMFFPKNGGEKIDEQNLGSSQTPQNVGKRSKSYIDIGSFNKTPFLEGLNDQKKSFLPFVEVNAQNWNTQKFNPTLLAKRIKLIADLVSGVRMRRNV